MYLETLRGAERVDMINMKPMFVGLQSYLLQDYGTHPTWEQKLVSLELGRPRAAGVGV